MVDMFLMNFTLPFSSWFGKPQVELNICIFCLKCNRKQIYLHIHKEHCEIQT